MVNEFDYNRNKNQSLRTTPIIKGGPIACFILCATFILISFFIEVEIITVSKGKVIPEKDIMYVNSVISNKISEVHVKNGDFIECGSEILRYDLTKEKERIKKYFEEKTKLENQIVHVNNIIDKIYSANPDNYKIDINNIETRRYEYLSKAYRLIELSKSRITSYEHEYRQNKVKSSIISSKISRVNKEISNLAKIIKTDSKLVSDGMIKKRDHQINLHNYELFIIELDKLKNEHKLSLDQLNNYSQKMIILKNELLYELETVRFEMLEKVKELDKKIQWDSKMVENEKLLSNFSGYVSDMTENIVGNFISSGEVILKIVPKDNLFRIRAYISSSDIGFIHLGQEVRVRIDTFNYNRYGYLNGKVAYVSKDSKNIDGDMSYELMISIDENTLNSSEEEIKIMSGLSVNADIVTGRRTIASYFLDPIIHSINYSLIER
ncbi:Membrane fusion protein (MFP) family protein [Vibrio crassostreae]|uniref:Membrane fusion protein (MFP) family protein n=1 Tax=Vibrio splendidus TaxID=29497 RepID=A0A2N7FJL7_VIBSP|nr:MULTISPECIES: HlyD family type I secretion periplasmic adaptor subunit [Vibrio]PMJ69503.1 hypothetical protein BCU17_13290 [Vibrio splendidus]TCN76904.1 HlyD family type I secretion membrane fusion protein [Vibrio crassostreae]CAK2509873.1 Membrane fusion protein (MFP) family protein [Vibrio crassostreae]CAK2520696.1 Membrane fusion protein (MFP) family protein [Vibrio crassostreae]CAK3859311.1 Membrane fusion protein (MFP) family protein [Vibrio crassostreae]